MDTVRVVSRSQGALITLSKDLRMPGTGTFNRGVKIVASKPVSVSAMSKACAAFLALPKDALGTEYYTITWRPKSSQFSLVSVTATQENTQVDLTIPSVRAVSVQYGGRTYRGGETLRVVLNTDQSVQLREAGTDLTGIRITANKPVSVNSGNAPIDIGFGLTVDDVITQVPPTTAWGRKFILVAFPNDNVGGTLKMVSKARVTNVRIVGTSSGQPLNNQLGMFGIGAYALQVLPSNSFVSIVSDQPILTVYYSNSESGSTSVGRPAGLLLPPVEQFMFQYSFMTLDNTYTEYALVTIEESLRTGLQLDGQIVPQGGWTRVQSNSSPQMVARWLGVSPGAHTLTHSNPRTTFGAYIYGYRRGSCAYAYPAGMRVRDLTGVSTIKSTTRTPCRLSYIM